MDPAMSQERIEEASRESNYTSPREITQKKIGKAEDAKLKIQKDIASALYGFLQKHLIIEILPLHAKVLTIERNMSIRVGLTALHEQKTPHCVVWDSLRGEYDGTLVLKDFLDVSINTNVPSSDEISKHISKYLDEDEEEKIPSEEAVNEDLNAPSTLFNDIAEEMENKSVFQIFEHVKCTKHKIVKIGYDESLKKIWDIMQDQGLKMAALESISDAENKIPSFIQGFLSYNDFLEFFVDNYDGDVKPFERTLTEIDIFYSKG